MAVSQSTVCQRQTEADAICMGYRNEKGFGLIAKALNRWAGSAPTIKHGGLWACGGQI